MCCSFSTAAATELKRRTFELTGVQMKDLRETCSTIHSEALRRIKQIKEDWKLYDGVTRSLRSFNIHKDVDNTTMPSKEFREERQITLAVWDKLRAGLKHRDEDEIHRRAAIAASEYHYAVRTSADSIMADIVSYENEKMGQIGAIDFTDMLFHALKTPGRSLDLLLVDEAQDCSALQWAVVEHWMKTAKKVILIADVDQCLHQWCGADYDGIQRKVDDGFEVRRLSKSWRVPAAAHSLARKIITMNKSRRLDAVYEPADKEGAVDYVGRSDVLEIARECAREQIPMLILGRTARIVNTYTNELAAWGIPFSNERGWSPMKSVKQRRVMFALLSLKNHAEITTYHARVLLNELKVRGTNLFSGTKKDAIAAIPGEADEMIGVDGIAKAGCDLHKILAVQPAVWPAVVPCLTNLKWLFTIARNNNYAALSEDPCVVLTTFHAAKGREAEVVVVNGSMSGPSLFAYRRGDMAEIEAERRCLYVAVTRTKQVLMIDNSGSDIYSELELA